MSSNKTFVGAGWRGKFSIDLSLKIEELNKLPIDKYGNIFISIHERKEADQKTKATHYACKNDYRYSKLEEKQQDEF